MTSSMPQTRPDSQPSSEHERVPLRHGLTAVIIRFRDDEPRPAAREARPAKVIAEQQAATAYNNWLAEQQDRRLPTGDGAA